jgi:caffeoyl-CoA O-methyltransferase
MDSIVDPEIEAYAIAMTSAVAGLYDRLREDTFAQTDMPQMQVGPLEGRALKMLVQLCGARHAVEIGTFTGYSALSIAEGLPEDGRLICLDKDPDTARRYWNLAPWGHKIDLRLGDAREIVTQLDGPFDFAFIDADKSAYIHYYESLMPKMRPGSLIAVDNVLWSGKVLDPQDDTTAALVAFNEHVLADPRTEQVLLTIRDGLLLVRKR